MRKLYTLIILIGFILIPQTILANGGTALMGMPIIQLMFGNILIGLIEGAAVSHFFKQKLNRSIGIMIGANYVSWIIGNLIVAFAQECFTDCVFELKGVFAVWIISLIILYLLTVFIELPFFNWILTTGNRRWKRSLKLSIILNAFTYTAMILLYLQVSKYSFFTHLKVDQSLLSKEYNLELFLKKNDLVLKGKISNDFKGEVIYQIPGNYEDLLLSLKRNNDKDTVDLVLANYHEDTLMVQKSFTNDSIHYPTLSNLKSDFRTTTFRNWTAQSWSHALDGMTIQNEDGTEDNYAFEVPWMFWNINEISIINDSVLICLIRDRLVLINKDTKEMAFITKADSYILRQLK